MDCKIGAYCCGVCKNKSTSDQIFVLCQILEKTLEFKVFTHHLFIDFRAAYDSISREGLYAAMEELKIPQKLIINLVRMSMKTVLCKSRI